MSMTQKMRAITCVLVAFPIYAQTTQQSATALDQLVAEVRGLRLAMEKFTTANTLAARAQILLQRLTLQQARAERLKGDSDKAAAAVTGFQAEQMHTLELMKRSETALHSSHLEPGKKESLLNEIAAYKSRLADQASREAQLRSAEAQIANEYRAAAAQLADLENRLAQIETRIAPTAP